MRSLRHGVVVEVGPHEGDPLGHPAGVGHEDHDHPPGADLHELEVRDAGPRERRVLHDGDLTGQPGEGADGAHEEVVEIAGGVEERADRVPLRRRERAQCGEMVHEDAVALVGRHAPGGGVRRRDQLLLLEEGHVVADRRGGDAEGVTVDDGLAADRLTGVDVVLHDRPQHLQSSIGDHAASSR